MFGGFSFSLPRTVASLVLILGSAVLVASCGSLFRKAGTPIRPVSPSTAIVSNGPYRLRRNPMYLGMACFFVRIGVLLGRWIIVVGALLFVAIVHFGIVLREERHLESLHGAAYVGYRQSVRRWL